MKLFEPSLGNGIAVGSSDKGPRRVALSNLETSMVVSAESVVSMERGTTVGSVEWGGGNICNTKISSCCNEKH